MKKTLLTCSALLFTVGLYAQNLVSTFPTGRNAVLEEFTGVNCGNCPDGHVRADQLFNAHPTRVVIINIHGTAYSGTPNLQCPYSDAIDNLAQPAGYPSGTMNRVVWSGSYNQPPYFPQNPPNALAIRRPGWWDNAYVGQGAGEYIILNEGNSVVNIGASSTYNSTTEELDIHVELYYVADDTVDNLLNVAILQNGVVGYQAGGGNNYVHNKILRDFTTGQWGETITNTSAGSLVLKDYTYSIPTDYNGISSDIDNMDIAVYVTRDDMKTVHTGIKFAAKDGQYVGNAPAVDLQSFDFEVYPNPMTDHATLQYNLSQSASVEMTISNVLGQVVYQQDLGVKPAGQGSMTLSKDALGLSGNMYLLTLTSGDQVITKKVLVK